MTSLPAPYSVSYSFTAFAQAQGNGSFPGVQIDLELQDIAAAIGQTAGFLSTAFRSDGRLANGSVTVDALSSGLQLGLNPPTVWTSGALYDDGDTITYGLALYACQAGHMAGVDFPGDLAAGYWAKIADFSTMGLLGAGTVGPDQLAPYAVGAGALAPQSVTTTALADAAVTRAKLGADVGATPVGIEAPFAGIRPPAGWVLEYGQALSRAAYPLLFAALTESTTCSTTAGSATLTGVAEDLSPFNLLGAALEGPGIPVGALAGAILGNSVTMVTATGAAAVATATGAGTSLLVAPHGNGDAATTFNVPDMRGRVSAGNDAMGGVGSGRLVGAMTSALGNVGGAAAVALTSDQLATHSHSLYDPGHAHGVTDPGHYHVYDGKQIVNGTSGSSFGSVVDAPNQVTSTSKTGIGVNSASTGIVVQPTGAGNPHVNVQPTRISNWIIFTGAAA